MQSAGKDATLVDFPVLCAGSYWHVQLDLMLEINEQQKHSFSERVGQQFKWLPYGHIHYPSPNIIYLKK